MLLDQIEICHKCKICPEFQRCIILTRTKHALLKVFKMITCLNNKITHLKLYIYIMKLISLILFSFL